MTRGLVLGKFAPFHRGHQRLVERSLATCDETVVLVYDSPEVTRIPLHTRCQWIKRIYPSVVVIAGVDAPSAAGRDPVIMRLQEDYITRTVPVPITHFFSGEWYGEHVSAALGAIDVRVDETRGPDSVSGTKLRADPFAHRTCVDPIVYRDLVRWVVLLGAESTGKSTLAEALARKLNTVFVPEFGRDFWVQHRNADGRLSPEQLVELAQEHRRREEAAALEANRMLVVDTDARTTRQYARWYHDGRVPPELDRLANDAVSRYALTVLCSDDIPYSDDGTRAGPERRKIAQHEILAELKQSGADWIETRGDVPERVDQVVSALRERAFLTWC